MQKLVRSQWFPISLLIAGLIVGYGFVTVQSGTAFAAGGQCPASHNCDSPDCTGGTDCASGDCHGNKA